MIVADRILSVGLIGHPHNFFRLFTERFYYLLARYVKRYFKWNPHVATREVKLHSSGFNTLMYTDKIAGSAMESHPDGRRRPFERVTNADAEAGIIQRANIAKAMTANLAVRCNTRQSLVLLRISLMLGR